MSLHYQAFLALTVVLLAACAAPTHAASQPCGPRLPPCAGSTCCSATGLCSTESAACSFAQGCQPSYGYCETSSALQSPSEAPKPDSGASAAELSGLRPPSASADASNALGTAAHQPVRLQALPDCGAAGNYSTCTRAGECCSQLNTATVVVLWVQTTVGVGQAARLRTARARVFNHQHRLLKL